MRIIARRTLRQFWESSSRYADAQAPLEAWYSEVSKEVWQTPHAIKEKYRNASILKNGRVVFSISGNKYRLIVDVDYEKQIVFIKFVGTHAQYDQVNAEVIDEH